DARRWLLDAPGQGAQLGHRARRPPAPAGERRSSAPPRQRSEADPPEGLRPCPADPDPARDRPPNARGRMADGPIELAFARSALRRCVLFAQVDDATLDTVCASLRARRYRRNETIFHQGDPGDALYIVESGSVKVVLPSPEGEDAAIIATLDRGAFFGELALLDGADHSATAVAVEPTQALVLRRE